MFFTMAKGSSDFKRKRSLEERKAEFAHVREKYPDRVPVIVEKVKGSDTPDMRRKRFLVPKGSNVGQFVYVIRKKLKLSPEKAIFVFVNDTLPSTAALVSTIYEQNKDEDGFLYMTYSSENTFGFCKENFKSVALF